MKQTRFIQTDTCGLHVRETEDGQQSRTIEGKPIVFGVRSAAKVYVCDDEKFIPVITKNTVFEELFLDKRYPKEIIDKLVLRVCPDKGLDAESGEGLDFDAMRKLNGYVLRMRVTRLGKKLPPKLLDEYIEEANKEIREYYEK